jgi:hypothetical protein
LTKLFVIVFGSVILIERVNANEPVGVADDGPALQTAAA